MENEIPHRDLSLEVEHLRLAVEHRTTIGKALGILMERYDLGDDQAFDYLRRLSQQSNRKLFEIANELVTRRSVHEDGCGAIGA